MANVDENNTQSVELFALGRSEGKLRETKNRLFYSLLLAAVLFTVMTGIINQYYKE